MKGLLLQSGLILLKGFGNLQKKKFLMLVITNRQFYFIQAINTFFQNINTDYLPNLQKLLTLNFQFFDKGMTYSYAA